MASASSQARKIKQFVCGTPRLERTWRAHLLDTIWSRVWHSRQMVSTSSQAQKIEESVRGTSQRERKWRPHLLDTSIQSSPWHSPQLASALSRQDKDRFVC